MSVAIIATSHGQGELTVLTCLIQVQSICNCMLSMQLSFRCFRIIFLCEAVSTTRAARHYLSVYSDTSSSLGIIFVAVVGLSPDLMEASCTSYFTCRSALQSSSLGRHRRKNFASYRLHASEYAPESRDRDVSGYRFRCDVLGNSMPTKRLRYRS
jgi:hypothetical protein